MRINSLASKHILVDDRIILCFYTVRRNQSYSQRQENQRCLYGNKIESYMDCCWCVRIMARCFRWSRRKRLQVQVYCLKCHMRNSFWFLPCFEPSFLSDDIIIQTYVRKVKGGINRKLWKRLVTFLELLYDTKKYSVMIGV